MVKPTKFYSKNLPEKEEVVRIEMIKMNDETVDCILIDYNITGIIPITELTARKRFNKRRGTIRSYYIPNKIISAKVNDITNSNTIIVSRKYINDYKKESLLIETSNSSLISFMNQLTYELKNLEDSNYQDIKQIDFDQIWEKVIYPIDKIKNEDTIFNFILKNMDIIKNMIPNNIFDKMQEIIINKEYGIIDDNYYKSETKKNLLTFQLVSPIGIDTTKKLIGKNGIINKIYDNVEFYYETAPKYVISVKNIVHQNKEEEIEYLQSVLDNLKKIVNDDFKSCFIKI